MNNVQKLHAVGTTSAVTNTSWDTTIPQENKPVVQNSLMQHIALKNFGLKLAVLMLNDSLPAHAQHLWSSEANQS